MAPRMKIETSDSQQATRTASTEVPNAQTAKGNPPVSAPKPRVAAPAPSVESAQKSAGQAAPAKKTVVPRLVPSVENPAVEPTTKPAPSAPVRPPQHVALNASGDASLTAESAEQRPAPAPRHAAAPKPKVNVQPDVAASDTQPRQADGWEYGERARSATEGGSSHASMPPKNVASQGVNSEDGAAHTKQRAGSSAPSLGMSMPLWAASLPSLWPL